MKNRVKVNTEVYTAVDRRSQSDSEFKRNEEQQQTCLLGIRNKPFFNAHIKIVEKIVHHSWHTYC